MSGVEGAHRVLIVDDEPTICWALGRLLRKHGYHTETAANLRSALEKVADFAPDVLVVDVRLPDGDGIEALQRLRDAANRPLPAVVMTAFGDVDTAARAVRQGAIEYLCKPFEPAELVEAVRRAAGVAESATPTKPRSEEPLRLPVPLLGRSPAMQRVFKKIALAAACDLPVLITGESGTGKELAARAIHEYSRRSGPFVPVCLPAYNPSLIESELFGHVRGAFTGAVADKPGLFQLAQRGTLFLDEIAEIPTGIQAKLLRVLETGLVHRVGSVRAEELSARIIAATNRRLSRLILRKRFRLDLYYRLSAIRIVMPPLRTRPEDVPLLAEHFLKEYQRMHGGEFSLPEETLTELKRRRWVGNVRELRHAIEYAAVVARSGPILPEHLPPERALRTDRKTPPRSLRQQLYDWGRRLGQQPERAGDLYELFVEECERAFLRGVVDACGGNLTKAARRLGIHRATLRTRLQKGRTTTPGTSSKRSEPRRSE